MISSSHKIDLQLLSSQFKMDEIGSLDLETHSTEFLVRYFNRKKIEINSHAVCFLKPLIAIEKSSNFNHRIIGRAKVATLATHAPTSALTLPLQFIPMTALDWSKENDDSGESEGESEGEGEDEDEDEVKSKSVGEDVNLDEEERKDDMNGEDNQDVFSFLQLGSHKNLFDIGGESTDEYFDSVCAILNSWTEKYNFLKHGEVVKFAREVLHCKKYKDDELTFEKICVLFQQQCGIRINCIDGNHRIKVIFDVMAGQIDSCHPGWQQNEKLTCYTFLPKDPNMPLNALTVNMMKVISLRGTTDVANGTPVQFHNFLETLLNLILSHEDGNILWDEEFLSASSPIVYGKSVCSSIRSFCSNLTAFLHRSVCQ